MSAWVCAIVFSVIKKALCGLSNFQYTNKCENGKAFDFIKGYTSFAVTCTPLCSGGIAIKPVNDKLKIAVSSNEFGFGDKSVGIEKGVVVEVPEQMLYYGFHSYAFDDSLINPQKTDGLLKFYNDLKGKTVYWESLQDRGRRFKVNGEEFVFLNMSDIIAYSDDPNINVEIVDQTGSAGSFNLS